MAHTLTEKLAAFFKANPYRWHDGRALAVLAGAYAWRTQVSRARREFGLNIVNRQRRIQRPDGTWFVISEYAYRPPAAASPRVSTAMRREARECRWCHGSGWSSADDAGRFVRPCVCRAREVAS